MTRHDAIKRLTERAMPLITLEASESVSFLLESTEPAPQGAINGAMLSIIRWASGDPSVHAAPDTIDEWRVWCRSAEPGVKWHGCSRWAGPTEESALDNALAALAVES